MSNLSATAYESLRAAVNAIRAHGMRSVLTTLGIVIGIASVIAVVAVLQGLTASIDKQLSGLGSNVLSVRADTPLRNKSPVTLPSSPRPMWSLSATAYPGCPA